MITFILHFIISTVLLGELLLSYFDIHIPHMRISKQEVHYFFVTQNTPIPTALLIPREDTEALQNKMED